MNNDMLKQVMESLPPRPLFGMGVQVFETPYAVKSKRSFPFSRYRSARLHKKLMKKHGGLFKAEPAIFATNRAIFVHPTLMGSFEREFGR